MEPDCYDRLLIEPEHWQRAGELVAAINDLSSLHPECDISAINMTEQALDRYPVMINSSIRRGLKGEAARFEQHMREMEIKSASGTSVSALILSNSHDAYNAARMAVMALFDQYQAEKDSDETPLGDSEVPEQPTGLPFDPEMLFIGARLFFCCK